MTEPTLYRKGHLIGEGLEDEIPLEYIMNWFYQRKNKVLILQSSTGSGKSTVLPPEFYERINSSKIVVCTQPRVMNAVTIPKRIVAFYDKARIPLILGYNIGYHTGQDSRKLAVSHGVIYMTIGVLYNKLIMMTDEEIIASYSCIFIDEAHERSTILGTTITLLKQFVDRQSNNDACPFIVIMSATLDVKIFSEYFNTDQFIDVKGASYPINETFLPTTPSDLLREIINQIVKYHKEHLDQKKFVDILVFIAGESDIKFLTKHLRNEHSKHTELKTYPLHIIGASRENLETNPDSVTEPLSKYTKNGITPFRRVIIGTNAIETGMTFDNLICVIDSGYYKSMEFDPIFEYSALITKPITQSMHIQRKGRAGRLAEGDCITMFTENTFKALNITYLPDIIKDDSIREVLNIIISQSDLPKTLVYGTIIKNFNPTPVDIFSLNLFELPTIHSINYNLNVLFYTGAITKDKLLTQIGFIMSKIRYISIQAVSMILWGYIYDAAIMDLIHIAAFQSNPTKKLPPFTAPFPYLCDEFITVLYSFDSAIETSDIKNLLLLPLIKVIKVKEDIVNSMISLGLNPYKNYSKRLILSDHRDVYNKIKNIKKCIFEGYKMNTLKKINNNYVNRLNNIVDVSDKLVHQLNPEYLIYNRMSMRQDNNTRLYEYKSEFTCILDGFVSVDEYFDVNA